MMIARREGETNLAYWKRQCEAEPVGPDADMQERIDRLNEKMEMLARKPKDAFGRPGRYEPPYECKR